MSTLAGQKVKDKYGNLLQVEGGVTTTLKNVEDGTGDVTALKLSTTAVGVGSLTFNSTPSTDDSELTGLFVDGSNNVVKRELNASAFSAASVTVFSNPMFVLRPDTSHTLTDTPATPTQGAINNNSITSSYLFNDSSNTHLQTSSTTTGAVTIERAGAIKIEINFILEITTANTDITIRVYRKPSGGSAAAIQTIVRSKVATGNMAIGFSLFTHCADQEDIYYEVGKNGSGGGSLTTQSTFTITKLD